MLAPFCKALRNMVSTLQTAVIQGCKFNLWNPSGEIICMNEAYRTKAVMVFLHPGGDACHNPSQSLLKVKKKKPNTSKP